jgi:hypothetical protein
MTIRSNQPLAAVSHGTAGPLTEGSVPEGSVNGADHRGQPGLAHRFSVLGVLQYRAQRLVGHRHGQLLLAEHADREGPGEGLGDARRLGQVQGPQPADRGRDLAGQPFPSALANALAVSVLPTRCGT